MSEIILLEEKPMIKDIFDDPRHRRAEELTARRPVAKENYKKAAKNELSLARDLCDKIEITANLPDEARKKIRTIFIISAISYFIRGESWKEAIRSCNEFICKSNLLLKEGVEELKELKKKALAQTQNR